MVRKLLLSLTGLLMAAANAAAGGPVEVAAGVWRVRFGTPEKFTPTALATAPPVVAALAAMPPAVRPFDLASVRFSRSARGVTVTVPTLPGEHLYGLGLNTRSFEIPAGRSFVVPSDNPEKPTNESHAPVPFYVSTAGYGVLVDTARYASFFVGSLTDTGTAAALPSAGPTTVATSADELYKARAGDRNSVVVDVPVAAGVDVYVFTGPTMLGAVRRYNLFSGGGCVPPVWGLGIAYRGLGGFSAEQSLALAERFRDRHLPCDIWGVEPGWQTRTYSSSFVWNHDRFPDPAGFVAAMHELGYRTSFWQQGFVHGSSPVYDALLPVSGNYKVWDGLVPDFSLPKTRQIFGDYQKKILFDLGVDSVKLDECDNQPFRPDPWSFPDCSQFPGGMDGEQMHSLFGILYQQTMLAAGPNKTWGLVRNSHALAAPLPYVIYSDSYDHADYLRGLAKSGFSGLLWTPEVRDAASVKELYRRIQTVIFSPYAMVNCWYMPLPPWEQINKEKNEAGELMPDHAAVTDTVRKLFQLRMRLIPYWYSAFQEYRRTGTPPVRAIVLDYPTDPAAVKIDDQVLVGPSLLVAPLHVGTDARKVYLPAGTWYDFWTNRKLVGPTTVNVAPAEYQVPMFVKDNSSIPVAEPVEFFDPTKRFELTVYTYGPAPTPAVVYDDSDSVGIELVDGTSPPESARYHVMKFVHAGR